MGFTVEDMLIISREKYKMELAAGRNGWANSISWLLQVEDTIITRNFKGKELVVTTGVGFDTTEKLMELVRILDHKHCSGLIINTGYYIREVPHEILEFADSCDLPLMTVPWDVEMSEMIKDLTVRIFLQSQADELISSAFIKALEKPELESEYREALSAAFDVDGKFQVVAFTTAELDTMDSVERKRVGYRLAIYLENISHNAHFFYYDGLFLLVLNAVDDASAEHIMKGFLERAKRRMPDQEVYVGVGSAVDDVYNVHISYKRAAYAAKFAMRNRTTIKSFDELGMYRLLYSVSDEMMMNELGKKTLAPLLEYDAKHNADLLKTLRLYLKYNGSVAQVSEEMFIHKNTIIYRMTKIRELLNSELEDGEERMMFYLAALICEQWALEEEQQEDTDNI